MNVRYIFFVILALFCSSAIADTRWNVYVSATANDLLGQRLVSAIRDKLASSPRFELGNSFNDSIFSLNIVTLNPGNEQNAQTSTIYTLVLLLRNRDNLGFPFFVNDLVGTCGAAIISTCVENVYATMDTGFGPIIQAFSQEKSQPPSPPAKKQKHEM